MNSDFVVTSEAICQSFSRVTKSRMKIIGKSYYVIHGNECTFFISNTLFYVLNTRFRWKTLSNADFAIVAKNGLFWLSIVTSPQLICDVTRTWDTGIVTSYETQIKKHRPKKPSCCVTVGIVDMFPFSTESRWDWDFLWSKLPWNNLSTSNVISDLVTTNWNTSRGYFHWNCKWKIIHKTGPRLFKRI